MLWHDDGLLVFFLSRTLPLKIVAIAMMMDAIHRGHKEDFNRAMALAEIKDGYFPLGDSDSSNP